MTRRRRCLIATGDQLGLTGIGCHVDLLHSAALASIGELGGIATHKDVPYTTESNAQYNATFRAAHHTYEVGRASSQAHNKE